MDKSNTTAYILFCDVAGAARVSLYAHSTQHKTIQRQQAIWSSTASQLK